MNIKLNLIFFFVYQYSTTVTHSICHVKSTKFYANWDCYFVVGIVVVVQLFCLPNSVITNN